MLTAAMYSRCPPPQLNFSQFVFCVLNRRHTFNANIHYFYSTRKTLRMYMLLEIHHNGTAAELPLRQHLDSMGIPVVNVLKLNHPIVVLCIL